MVTNTTIHRIVASLKQEYGFRLAETAGDPLSVLVQTILSQNTSDKNSGNAFSSLIGRFGDWEQVAAADVNAIADSIRSGGLGDIKALRIKQVLGEIKRRQRALDITFLTDLPPLDAEKWLLELPGVGLKTARCVLLFALHIPVLPVDTHILRVSGRLGLIPPGTTAEQAHRLLGEMVPPEEVYNFHVLVIEHGRRICRARKPDCPKCALGNICRRVGV